jgi:type IV pilus assembly protein PilC
MKKFIFTARDQQGKMITGGEEAENADALVSRLQLRGLLVTNIRIQADTEPAVSSRAGFSSVARKFSHHRIKEEDLCLFGRQLATAIGSGVPLLKSLDIINRQAASKKLFDALSIVIHDVESGLSFRDALAKHPNVFSSLWVNLVETGEASGNLPLVLERLVVYLEGRAAFKRKIVSALIYPMLLTVVAFGAIIIFLIAIVPKFVTIFEGFGKKLPTPTMILISVSNLLTRNFFFIFIAFCGILYISYQYARSKSGKARLDRFVLSAPVVKEFFRLSEIEKFASGMSTLLESGVPILFSLEIAERSSGNGVVQDIIKKVKESVREGKPLVGPMEESGFFPPMITQMVNIGEEIGELDKMFKKISAFYSEMLETKITRLTTLFEPIMIVFMGVVIGGMVISMFIPIFSIANIGGG